MGASAIRDDAALSLSETRESLIREYRLIHCEFERIAKINDLFSGTHNDNARVIIGANARFEERLFIWCERLRARVDKSLELEQLLEDATSTDEAIAKCAKELILGQ